MPADFTGDLHTALTANAFLVGTDRGFLRITGSDAPRWLNGMVTNNVQSLQPGQGNYNFLLNAQGRIQGDATIYREAAAAPSFLLATDRAQRDTLQQTLDRFIIMDDVELTPVDLDHNLLLLGPTIGDLLPAVAPGLSADLVPLRLQHIGEAVALTPAAGLVPQLELAFPATEQLDAAVAALTQSGTLPVTAQALEQLRILEARPRYGTDIRNTETAKDLPQETNQAQSLHFSKGCYLGQEIVERIRSRGQVHRLFTPFRLDGAPVTNFPAPLEANGKPAGELTSAAEFTTANGSLWLAVGYARREALETRATFNYPGGTAHPRAIGKLT